MCKKGSGSIFSFKSSLTLVVSPAKNDLVDFWPNLWCNNYTSMFFLAGNLFFFEISFIFPRKPCFLCELCGKVTALSPFAPKYTVQNPLWKKQVCPAFINILIENNLSNKSGAKSTLCNVAIKRYQLLLHTFLYMSFLLRCDVMSIRNFNVFICIF